MSSIYSMHRPGFWRVPDNKNKKTPTSYPKKKVHFKDDYYVSIEKIDCWQCDATENWQVVFHKKNVLWKIWRVNDIQT